MSFAIEIKNLNKSYIVSGRFSNQVKYKTAVNDLSLTVKKGAIFGLLGPNGAGKSTLINILAGTTLKTSGMVKINDIDLDQEPKKIRYHIGVVPQEIVIDSFFPLYKGLLFTAGYYGISKSECKAEEILRALGLWDKRNNLPRQLSGGMKRRYLIAKAMIHFPSVLVLDEPTAGVDLELRYQLWDYLKKLNQKGTTIIITTHYLQEAQDLCDEIAFINHGKIIQQDSKKNLLTTLGSRYLFIETVNIINHQQKLALKERAFDLIEDNKIKLELKNDDYKKIGDILSFLQEINLEISDLQIASPDLESIFQKIIEQK